MFCGIVANFCEVKQVLRQPSFYSIGVCLPPELREGIELGASIAIDGVCLTVTQIASDIVTFDVINETLRVTTLNALEVGSLVNVERSLRANTEVGGHIVSGHVDGVATICAKECSVHNCTVVLSVKPDWIKYIFPKGFIALNGISLTVGFVDRVENKFAVYLIPETLRRTTFGIKQVGDLVNFEVDRQTQTIVDTMNVFLERLEQKLLSGDFPNRSAALLNQESKNNLLEEFVPAMTTITSKSE